MLDLDVPKGSLCRIARRIWNHLQSNRKESQREKAKLPSKFGRFDAFFDDFNDCASL